MEELDPRWRKSSYSGNGGQCVEVGEDTRRVLVRDTQDRTGPVLRFSLETWRSFADQVKRSLASDLPGGLRPALWGVALCRGAVPFAVSPGGTAGGHPGAFTLA